MREDNLDAKIAKREIELDAFGHVSRVVSQLTTGYEPQGKVIRTDDVMTELAKLGYGSMPIEDWQYLFGFRLFLPSAYAELLVDCLFQVCNGRVRTRAKVYHEIHNGLPKSHAWPKVFLPMETYCLELLHRVLYAAEYALCPSRGGLTSFDGFKWPNAFEISSFATTSIVTNSWLSNPTVSSSGTQELLISSF